MSDLLDKLGAVQRSPRELLPKFGTRDCPPLQAFPHIHKIQEAICILTYLRMR